MSRPDRTHFAPLLRVIHWTMALLVLAMLFIGVGMVSTTGPAYVSLLALHRPLGIAILLLALVRLAIRLGTGAPPLPDDLPKPQKLAAKGSHGLLYAAMIGMPLIGWAMLSAADDRVSLSPSLALPAIMPHDLMLYWWLRQAHTVIGVAFFLLILLHLAAALMHGLIRRDGVWQSMTFGKIPGKRD
ncbi:MAG: cytochrome b/b6 domain-containing protein [Sphingomonadales bacterium]|nr:cytochrome b/b6 domain-containing protein [Sphingomonadales bacterium]MDE2171803.1 cytochrome b/b6 domain-containing protein [Sphingomonadales bacterium]